MTDIADLIARLDDAGTWIERNFRALVTEDDGGGSFIRGTGTELAGFEQGLQGALSTVREVWRSENGPETSGRGSVRARPSFQSSWGGRKMRMMARLFWLVVVGLMAVGCGEMSPTAPSPAPRPEPIPAPVAADISGTWTGRLDYMFDGQPYGFRVTLTVEQVGSAVSGTWTSAVDWSGALSGELVGLGADTVLNGVMTFRTTSTNPKIQCDARGPIAGPAVPPAMRWTVARVLAVNCEGVLEDAVFAVSRPSSP